VDIQNKIVSEKMLNALLLAYRIKNDKIVFTNGCFDILHKGHITLLNKAKSFGNRLIVGLNTDASITELKGPNRPINKEEDRAFLLAALSCVDLVVLFSEATPQNLIQFILPDILVKGGDYKKNEIVGADTVEKNGGKVEIVSLVENYSTTKLIKQMQE